MEVKNPFILIDDDDDKIDTLKKIIERAVPSSPIYSFSDGLEGWEFISRSQALNIVICNLYLPTLSGIKILKNSRNSDNLKKNYFIMITSDSDKDENINAMQQGADDFLSSSFSVDELLGKLRTATRFVKMQLKAEIADKRIQTLEEDLRNKSTELMDIIFHIQKERIPNFLDSLSRITEMALWIAEEYGNKDITFISNLHDACNLCYSGKLFLPDISIGTTVTTNGQPKNEKMERIPEFLKTLFSDIKGMENVFTILYYIYENFDGSGHPEKKQSKQIPIGSRILRVVLDYEEYYIQKKYDNDKIVELMSHESSRVYDPIIITLLDQFMAHKSFKAKIALERPIQRNEIREGMVLSRQIVTETGLKLMSKGTYLSQEFVDKIMSITKNDPIIGKIYIRN